MASKADPTNDLRGGNMTESPEIRVIEKIPIHLIDVVNPRDRNRKIFKEFVSNIAKVGLKRPITVARREKADGTRYDLVCGQGRLEAFQVLGQTKIPAIVIAADAQEGLLMSLVENIARCPYRPIDQLQDVTALKGRGYSEADIAKKIGASVEYTRGILHLLEVGEHRLLRAVDAGQIPVSVAIDIAAANQSEIQHILQQAYEQNLLRGRRLVAAKRLLVQRRQKGKGLSDKRLHTTHYSLSELLKTYEEDTERKRLLVRKAEITKECLTFIVEAFRQLRRDHSFMALLKAEGLDSIPKNLDLRIASEEAYA
jgi:ParB family transcriptional regulator, chromosome partitioning protein